MFIHNNQTPNPPDKSGQDLKGAKCINFKYQFIQKYIWESPLERELVYSFTGNIEEIPVLNFHEIEAGKYWPLQEIRENIGKDIFTPNFEHEFNMLFITTSKTIINSK